MSHTPKGGLCKEAMQNNCNGDKELEDVVETLFSLDTRAYELTFGEQCRELYYLKKTEKFRDITLKRIGTLLGVSGNVISVHARREQKTKKEVGRPCLLNAEMKKYLRPSTLFGSNFEGYLNQKTFPKKQKSNKFNNFESRKYDMNNLEAMLLNSQIGGHTC